MLGKSSLRYFDISNNPLYDEGAICIVKGLLEGPLVTEAEAKRDPSRGPAWSRRQPKLRQLIMRNVSMGDEAGMVLT